MYRSYRKLLVKQKQKTCRQNRNIDLSAGFYCQLRRRS